jgi:hypothetical protein
MSKPSEPLSISQAETHRSTHVISGDKFVPVGPGHYAAQVFHDEGPTAQHANGSSPFFNGVKDGYNTTRVDSVNTTGPDAITVGVSLCNEHSGKLKPREPHASNQPGRALIYDKQPDGAGDHYGTSYHVMIPAGSTPSSDHVIHWASNGYTSQQAAEVDAVAPLNKPFRAPEKFESGHPDHKGHILYKKNDADPCVAHNIFKQNTKAMDKIEQTTLSNGKATDGSYFLVPNRLDKEVSEHVAKVKTAHEVLSKSGTKPGMAIHLIGVPGEVPKWTTVTLSHTSTPDAKMPKAPPPPTQFSAAADGGVQSGPAMSTDFELKPIDGTPAPEETMLEGESVGGGDKETAE